MQPLTDIAIEIALELARLEREALARLVARRHAEQRGELFADIPEERKQ